MSKTQKGPDGRDYQIYHTKPRNVLARKTVLAERINTPQGQATIPPGSWIVAEDVGGGVQSISVMPDDAFHANCSPGSWAERYQTITPIGVIEPNGKPVLSLIGG